MTAMPTTNSGSAARTRLVTFAARSIQPLGRTAAAEERPRRDARGRLRADEHEHRRQEERADEPGEPPPDVAQHAELPAARWRGAVQREAHTGIAAARQVDRARRAGVIERLGLH